MVYFATEFCSLSPKAVIEPMSTYESGYVQAKLQNKKRAGSMGGGPTDPCSSKPSVPLISQSSSVSPHFGARAQGFCFGEECSCSFLCYLTIISRSGQASFGSVLLKETGA